MCQFANVLFGTVCYFGTGSAHVIALSFLDALTRMGSAVGVVCWDVLLFVTIHYVLVPLCYFAS